MKIVKYILIFSLLMLLFLLVHWYNPEGDNLQKIREKYNTAEDRYVNINGVNAHYIISGQGETLIIIHGNQGYAKEYDGFREALDKNFRVIAIDLMGHGFSENAIDDDYSLSSFNCYIENTNRFTAYKQGAYYGAFAGWIFSIAVHKKSSR
jgi:hypothetical protein